MAISTNKTLSRRQFVQLTVGSVAPHALSRFAWAQTTWPNRPIVLTHGFAPGGGVDATARILADGLSRRLGQPIIVEPKPGAGTTLAAAQLARASSDGHTLSLLSSTYATAAAMYKSLSFRPVDDFTMVTMVTEFPYVIATYSDHPIRDIASLISASSSAPKPLLYGTSGIGSVSHLLLELLAQSANVRFQHVPYRGGAQALTELLGKRIDLMLDPPTILMEQVKSGNVRILAVSTAARAPMLPDIPTIAESGFPGFDVPGWVGLAGPARLPESIVQHLNSEIAAVMADPAIADRIRSLGNEPAPSTPDRLKARLASDIGKWTSVIAAAKIERI
jgi:tripartite-type tricarboxylate transporter receptor subunit TctC